MKVHATVRRVHAASMILVMTVAAIVGWPLAVSGQTIPVTVVRIYDGDTITVDAVLWPGISIRSTVRLDGIDTPELRGGCDASKAKAREARDVLAKLLTGAAVEIRDPFHGRYAGRVVADVLANGREVGPILVRAGMALPYDGGTRADWCLVLDQP